METHKVVINNKNILITHPSKILFPKDKITKMDLINYYMRISDYILPFIKDHPLTINCFTEGIDHEGFYRQHAPSDLPEWFTTCDLKLKTGGMMTHILCQNKESLIYLVNQNMVALHRWLSTIKNPEKPEILIVDIDPPHQRFDLACKASRLIKKNLESLNYKPYLLITGSRGCHIISKLKGKESFESIREMLHSFTSKIASDYPNEFSVDVRKKNREDLVYLDITRNAYGQTAIAPFSVRAKDNSPIATPIAWEELEEKDLSPNKYNIKNIFDRLHNIKENPWHDYFL